MRNLLPLLLVFSWLALCCSSPETEETFSSFNLEAFMAACTQTSADVAVDDSEAVVDPQYITDICGCVFDTARSNFVFSEFESLDNTLVSNPDVPLPAQLREAVADCVISVLEL